MTDENRDRYWPGKSPFARLSEGPGNPFLSCGKTCQWCKQAHPDTKYYPLLHLNGFLCVIHGWIDRLIMCPVCMRAYLLARLPGSVMSADFLCPIVIAWWAALFIRTFLRRMD
jgi:hypothetical protein